MTVIPISNLSQAEIRMLGTNVVSAARHDCEINAVNRLLLVHDEQVESLLDRSPVQLTATA